MGLKWSAGGCKNIFGNVNQWKVDWKGIGIRNYKNGALIELKFGIISRNHNGVLVGNNLKEKHFLVALRSTVDDDSTVKGIYI